MHTLLASLPSPPNPDFHIGPIRVTFYGILIAIGVAVAWQVTERRFAARGGDVETLGRVLGRVIIFGFIGARIAYVSTHLSRFEGEWWKVVAVWEGGLALYGGLTVGAWVFWHYSRKWGLDLRDVLDSVAPAVPFAQAIGRWGNYFNQELFGTPSDLPWAIEIEPSRRPQQFLNAETFHPTFLYESIWNVGLAFFIIWAGKRYPQLRGRLVGIYFVGYGLIRFLTELIRTDTSFRLLGLSRNAWVSIGVMILGALVLTWKRSRAGSAPETVTTN